MIFLQTRALSISICSLLCLVLFFRAAADDVTDVALATEQLKHAETFYWLARARNNSLVEIDRSLFCYRQAAKILDRVPATAQTQKLRSTAAQGVAATESQKACARVTLQNFSPLAPLMMGADSVLQPALVGRETALLAAYARAVDEAIAHPMLTKQGPTLVIIISKNGDTLAEETAAARLSAQTVHYAVPRQELVGLLTGEEIASLRAGSAASPMLEKVAGQYNVVGVGIIRLVEEDRIDNLTYASANLRYWSRSHKEIEFSCTTQGFSEYWPLTSYWAFGLVAIGLPISRLMRRLLGRRLEADAPVWLAPVASVVCIGLVMVMAASLGRLRPDMSASMTTAQGIGLIALFGLVISAAPVAVCLLAAVNIPHVRRAMANENAISSLLFGALMGCLATLVHFAWARLGASATLLVAAGTGIIVLPCLCALLGAAYGRFTAWKEGWAGVEGLALGLLCVFYMGSVLMWRPAGMPWFSALVLCAACGIALTRRHLQRQPQSTAGKISSPVEAAAPRLRQILAMPPFVTSAALERALESALAFAAGERTEKPLLRILYIEGDSGCGKTRLVREMMERLDKRSKADGVVLRVLVGGCLEAAAESHAWPYPPFAQSLEELLGVNRFADPARNIATLQLALAKTGLRATLGAVGLGALGLLLNVSASPDSPGRTSVQDTASVITATIRRLTENSLVVWMIEDLHWIDPDSLALMKLLLSLLPAEPNAGRVCFVFTSRPCTDNPLRSMLIDLSKRGKINLCMDDRSLAEVDQSCELVLPLLENLGCDYRMSASLSTECQQQSVGRPAYVLEMVRGLLEKGWAQVREDGGLHLAKETRLKDLPACHDLHAMMARTFATLDPQLVDILQCCALIGTQFKVSMVARVFRLDLLSLLRQLRVAEEKLIVEDVYPVDDLYQFIDQRTAGYFREFGISTVRDAQLPQRIREYHKRVFLAIESNLRKGYPQIRNAQYSDIVSLANHATQVKDVFPEKAMQLIWLAAEKSCQRAMLHAAIAHFKNADEIARMGTTSIAPQDLFSFYIAYTRCLLDAEIDPPQRERNIEAIKSLLQGDDRHGIDPALRGQAGLLESLHLYRGRRYEEANIKARELAADASLPQQQVLRAHLYAAISMKRSTPQEVRDAVNVLMCVGEQIDAALVTQPTDAQVTGELLAVKSEAANSLGFLYLNNLQETRKARQQFECAISIKSKLSEYDWKGIAMAHGGLGDCFLLEDDEQGAAREYVQNYEISRRAGDMQGVCRMTSMLGSLELRQAEAVAGKPESTPLLRRAQRWYEESLNAAVAGNATGVFFALAGLVNASSRLCVVAERDANLKRLLEECHLWVAAASQVADEARSALRDALTEATEVQPGNQDTLEGFRKLLAAWHGGEP